MSEIDLNFVIVAFNVLVISNSHQSKRLCFINTISPTCLLKNLYCVKMRKVTLMQISPQLSCNYYSLPVLYISLSNVVVLLHL